MENGIYAKITTNKGVILLRLTYDKTLATVGNFVALAEGKMKNSQKPLGTPYYNGLTFHRIGHGDYYSRTDGGAGKQGRFVC